jgi:hypothetical protein
MSSAFHFCIMRSIAITMSTSPRTLFAIVLTYLDTPAEATAALDIAQARWRTFLDDRGRHRIVRDQRRTDGHCTNSIPLCFDPILFTVVGLRSIEFVLSDRDCDGCGLQRVRTLSGRCPRLCSGTAQLSQVLPHIKQ